MSNSAPLRAGNPEPAVGRFSRSGLPLFPSNVQGGLPQRSVVSPTPLKGRGAIGNPTGRFERFTEEVFDDGWGFNADEGFVPPPIKTTVSIDRSKTIITRNQSPDIPFDRSINPYRGCEHGCVYCFARPTHAWLGLSPGLDFETRLFMKPEAAALLETELMKPGYRCKTLAMGTNTDPYQPTEREHRITRQVLEVLAKFNHPVSIVTKSALILRDIDILGPMAERGLASVGISVTTLDRELARRMEPRAASPAKRLATITGLAEAGIPVRVMASPIIPSLNDHELESILKAARDAGAIVASYILLRLPLEVKELFSDWLTSHYPHRATRVLQLVRDTRQGKLNDARWNSRFVGEGVYAKSINRRFAVAIRKLGLDSQHKPLNRDQFRRPAHLGEQLSLL